MIPEDIRPNPDPRCDCIHGPSYHDPVSGACLKTNIVHGPCPCAATPERTRAALLAVHELQQRYAADPSQAVAYGRA